MVLEHEGSFIGRCVITPREPSVKEKQAKGSKLKLKQKQPLLRKKLSQINQDLESLTNEETVRLRDSNEHLKATQNTNISKKHSLVLNETYDKMAQDFN